MIDLLNLELFRLFCLTCLVWLLDIPVLKWSRRQQLRAVLLLLVIATAEIAAILLFSLERVGMFDSVFLLISAYLYFASISEYKGFKVLFVILATIAISTIPNNLFAVLLAVVQLPDLALLFVRLALYIVAGAAVYMLLRVPFKKLLRQIEEGYWIFCLIPMIAIISQILFRYLGDHKAMIFGGHRPPDLATLLYSLPIYLVTIASFALVPIIFNHVTDKASLQNEQDVMKMQMDALRQQISQLTTNEQQAQLYRHDLRHHFALISAYLAKGKIDELQKYTDEALKRIDSFSPARFCENETVNLMLSYYSVRAEQEGVPIDIAVELPQELPLSNMEVCSIISNGLDNAIRAAAQCGSCAGVHFIGKLQNGRMAIRIQNPFSGVVDFNGDIPVAASKEHGLGVRSIVSIVSQHKGVYEFSVDQGLFTLSLVV